MRKVIKTALKRKKRYSSMGRLFNYPRKKCMECGEIFKPNTNVAKYCSLTCQNRNRRKRKADWIREYNLKYSKKNPIKTRKWKEAYNKEWIKNNPEKYKAQIKSRKIKIKSCCDICGRITNLERHHWRYDKPILVNTLCKSCHKIQHIKGFQQSSHGRLK